jgi:KAP family P-loop domain
MTRGHTRGYHSETMLKLRSLISNRPASGGPPVMSETVDPETVKAELREIKDHLLKSSWYKELQDREGVELEQVDAQSVKYIKELTEQDNTYSLGLKNYNAQRRKKETSIWAAPLWVRLTIAIPCVYVLAAVVLSIVKTPIFLLLLTVILFPLLPPFLAIDWWERNSKKSEVSAEAAKATTDVEKSVRSVIERSVRAVVHPDFKDPFKDVLDIGEGAGLSSRVDYHDRIITRYRPAVELHLLRPGGAAVGVTGERGIGKSELLRSFCDNSADEAKIKSGGTIQVFVAVPSAFRGIEFLSLIAQELARAVPGFRTVEEISARRKQWLGLLAACVGFIAIGLSIVFIGGTLSWRITHLWISTMLSIGGLILILGGEFLFFMGRLRVSRRQVHRDAERLALRLTYAETISSQTEGSVSWSGVGLKRSGGRSLSSLPLTEGALIFEIKTLADKLARSGYRIVIGIDEMDKLESGQATDEFLNSVKQLFAIKECSFIVSVSTSAWAKFVRRGINLRDALDSSLDAIESVGALDFREVRSLILHRRVEMRDSQTLLCYILSGGLPREAMRFARALATRNRDGEVRTHTLAEVGGLVLDDEAKRLIDASKTDAADWPDIDRVTMYRKCDYLRQWWLSELYAEPRAVQEFSWLPDDSFLWTGGFSRIGKNLRGDAQESFARLGLMLKFLMIVRILFCQSDGPSITAFPADEVLRIGDRLAVIRRGIEIDAPGAERALRDIFEDLSRRSLEPVDGQALANP